MTPGLAHALLGLALWTAVAVPLGLWRVANAPWFGFAVVVAAYASRERRQSEEWFENNRIAIWKWRPRAWRDMAWPILTAGIATAHVVLLWR